MTTQPPRRPAVAAGMQAARARGVRLGRPRSAPPEAARRAAELRTQGQSLAAIADALNTEQLPTPSGRGVWTKSSVQYALTRLDQQPGDGDA